jgi:hypothetical protein
MFENFFADPNLPFAVALLIMVGLGIIEGVGTVLGLGLSGLLDSLLPDLDLDLDLDADVDGPDIAAPGIFQSLLGWFHVGRVPVLILFIFFLLCFGLLGLFVQATVESTLGTMLPAWMAAIPVFIVSLLCVRVFGSVLARIMPKEETEAVSSKTFIGRVAVVVTGTARAGEPAQAKLRDQHGHTHYVMVEPDMDDEDYPTGSDVLLVSQAGAVFRAIKNPNPSLLDT